MIVIEESRRYCSGFFVPSGTGINGGEGGVEDLIPIMRRFHCIPRPDAAHGAAGLDWLAGMASPGVFAEPNPFTPQTAA